LGTRSGLAIVIASLCRVRAGQGLAVVGAEQEGEPVQVLAQLAEVVCGVADELFRGGAEAAGIAGQPLGQELQQFGELGGVGSVEPYFEYGVTAFRDGLRGPCNGRSPGQWCVARRRRSSRR
jgi:hypothetical protein